MHPSNTHIDALRKSLDSLEQQTETLLNWGVALAEMAQRGSRLLVVGNGGSAAQAQHLTAELVGRYCHDRHPISAIALHSETSSLTAIVNDFGAASLFSRQVQAHGRRGDVLLALSTSGRSPNVVAAAVQGRKSGLKVWALTGPGPNPLLDAADEGLAITSDETATIQELHLIAIHMMCAALDETLGITP